MTGTWDRQALGDVTQIQADEDRVDRSYQCRGMGKQLEVSRIWLDFSFSNLQGCMIASRLVFCVLLDQLREWNGCMGQMRKMQRARIHGNLRPCPGCVLAKVSFGENEATGGSLVSRDALLFMHFCLRYLRSIMPLSSPFPSRKYGQTPQGALSQCRQVNC